MSQRVEDTGAEEGEETHRTTHITATMFTSLSLVSLLYCTVQSDWNYVMCCLRIKAM